MRKLTTFLAAIGIISPVMVGYGGTAIADMPSAGVRSAVVAQHYSDDSVQLRATPTAFQPSILYDGGEFTSVKVTVTNNGKKEVSVNPLYFTITAADGGKHNATLGEDERQIDTLDLAPGEHVTGVITAEGKFQPARVTYSVNGFGDKVTADVK